MIILLHPDHIKQLKKLGFFYAVCVNRNISFRPVGSVEAVTRNLPDARRLASSLNSKYGPHSYSSEAL